MNELEQWLIQNAEHFKNYAPDEIADVAIVAGFDRALVAQWKMSKTFRAIQP